MRCWPLNGWSVVVVVCVYVGTSSLSARACRDAVLPQVSVDADPAPAADQHPAAAASPLITAGPLAELSGRAASELHSDGQPTQPTRRTDRTGQEPDLLCQTGTTANTTTTPV